MSKKILKIILIFVLGSMGGVWAQASLLPYMAEFPIFKNVGFIKNLDGKQVTINPTQTITVQENDALTQAIERVEKSIVGVKTETNQGKILEGTGLAVTSDGLIVTLAELVPQGSDFYFYIDGKWPTWQILKRDLNANLVLIKVNESGLSTAGFADLSKVKIGERVFSLDMEFIKEDILISTSTKKLLVAPELYAADGIISHIGEDLIQVNIQDSTIAGSPLFNISGDVIGINFIDKNGKVSVIPISVIRDFIGF